MILIDQYGQNVKYDFIQYYEKVIQLISYKEFCPESIRHSSLHSLGMPRSKRLETRDQILDNSHFKSHYQSLVPSLKFLDCPGIFARFGFHAYGFRFMK
jgi:hypothetical protein